jgi:hypothetical protein
MALPVPRTAGEMAEHLRRNDSTDEWLALRPQLYRNMHAWTTDETRQVLDAAERNTSVRTLLVDVAGLGDRAAVLVSLILRQLKNLRTMQVSDTSATAATSVVDNVLRDIMMGSSKVKELELLVCSGPAAFLEFCECYQDSLECLYIAEASTANPTFASAVACAWGQLDSLRRVSLGVDSLHKSTPCLLSTLHTSSTVKTLDVVFNEHSHDVLGDAALFCRCTTTVERVRIAYDRSQGNAVVNMYALLDIGYFRPFSATIKEVQFFRCDFIDGDGALLNRAADALRNVEFLRFGNCHFPAIFSLLERLPRLKKFSCLARRAYYLQAIDSIDDADNDYNNFEALGLLKNNEDLRRLCQVIKQRESALDDIELDLVGYGADGQDNGSHYVAYPAIDELLRCCKGRLTLNWALLPWESHLHILGGMEHLGEDLKELRIRFHGCQLGDEEFAKVLRALRSNGTLRCFEIGFGARATLASSIAAIYDLVESNNTLQVLSLRGLGLDAAAVLSGIMPALAATNRSLRTLKLREADMTDRWTDVLRQMKDMLKVNRVLSAIEECDLPEDNPEASAVRDLLRLNEYGRRFWTAEDLSTKKIWATVLGRISKHNRQQMMYTFLRAKPGGEARRVCGKRNRSYENAGRKT